MRNIEVTSLDDGERLFVMGVKPHEQPKKLPALVREAFRDETIVSVAIVCADGRQIYAHAV